MEKTEQPFKLGDRVRIVNYGHPIASTEKDLPFPYLGKDDNGWHWYDMQPNKLGQEDVVTTVSPPRENYPHYKYGLSKSAWYDAGQLELL